MREALLEVNRDLVRDGGVTLQIRTGVNTGEVLAGELVAGQSLVTGDAVNVAARLEQSARPGEILIGGSTHRLVRDAVEVERIEPMARKRKSEPVEAYRLIRVVPGAEGLARRMDSPMVGRERQRRQLAQAFESATTPP
jgi:class 3 adenylate cyclase